ncbi:MAG TPA: transposase [Nitrospirota bacterium]|nr:transposase [Nitrospirota bacterium]
MSRELRTYQCRIAAGKTEDELLSAYAALYGKAERTLFAKLQSGGNLTDLKREFLPKFGITARQFNALATEVKGKIRSIKERRVGLILEAEQRIAKAKSVLSRITDPGKRHQKKRRLATLQAHLDDLNADHARGAVRICFGSRKLFRAQFNLEANAYESRDEWYRDWQTARSSQFFVIGSKDETAGCQGCVATVAEDGNIALRLRLPNALPRKYLSLRGLRFNHGHEAIVAAVGRNLSQDKKGWQAINYRLLKDEKGWRVFVTIALPEVLRESIRGVGVIGIDINACHLAVTETDRFGNPIEYFSVPCVTYGKSSEQRKATIGDALKSVMAFAVKTQKPLVIERLDFQKKKSALEEEFPRYTRMLSSLAYTQVQTFLRARAFDAGIEVYEVDPAYTSVIGRYKFGGRYGMSAHNAAALVIGRRSSGFGESLPSQLHGTLPLPARNRGRHVWSQWAAVSRKDKAVLAAHGRSGSSRSSLSLIPIRDKSRLVTIPPESVRPRHANRHEHCSSDVMALWNIRP